MVVVTREGLGKLTGWEKILSRAFILVVHLYRGVSFHYLFWRRREFFCTLEREISKTIQTLAIDEQCKVRFGMNHEGIYRLFVLSNAEKMENSLTFFLTHFVLILIAFGVTASQELINPLLPQHSHSTKYIIT